MYQLFCAIFFNDLFLCGSLLRMICSFLPPLLWSWWITCQTSLLIAVVVKLVQVVVAVAVLVAVVVATYVVLAVVARCIPLQNQILHIRR